MARTVRQISGNPNTTYVLLSDGTLWELQSPPGYSQYNWQLIDAGWPPGTDHGGILHIFSWPGGGSRLGCVTADGGVWQLEPGSGRNLPWQRVAALP